MIKKYYAPDISCFDVRSSAPLAISLDCNGTSNETIIGDTEIDID